MKKSMLALVLVLALVLTSNSNVFAATTGVVKEFESYKDSKTGLELSYPEDWTITIGYTISYTTTGQTMKGRKVVLSNSSGDYKVEIIQLRTASLESGSRFVVKTPSDLYYVSVIQSITEIDSSCDFNTNLDERQLQNLIDASDIVQSITINSGK